jgi:phosphate uptake regulator
VIQIAGSTCLISLPRKWITDHHINKGDELNIDPQGHKIILSTDTEFVPKKMIISCGKFGKFHPNQLSAVYHMGYEEVEIEYSDHATLPSVQQRINNCIGYEIVDQGDNFCRIKTISKASIEEFDQILRKVFLLLLSMGKNCTDIMDKKDYTKLKEVKVLEITNNKLTDFCKRVINVNGYKDHSKITVMYSIATYLEMMADEYRDICDALANKKTKISPKTIEDFKDVNELFNIFYQSFYKFSAEKVEEVFEKAQPLRKKLLEKMTNADAEEMLLLHSLSNILSLIYEMATANLELNL